MMRVKAGILCALAVAIAGGYACSSNGHGGGGLADAHHATCGDGVCDATEINTCPQDCGMAAGPCNHDGVCDDGETTASCPSDCSNGSNTGSDMGSNMGSGALNCADMNTAIGCIACDAIHLCTPPITVCACAACGIGSAMGSGC